MPYKKDKNGKIALKKVDDFWHPIKKNGTLSQIKGSTQVKAMNALRAYEAIKHGAKKK